MLQPRKLSTGNRYSWQLSVNTPGRLLKAVRILPPSLWRHLGEQLGVAAPDLPSLRSMYHRRRTLFEHQEVACETLGFHWLSHAQCGALVRVVRDELSRTFDRQRVLQFARRWLYDPRLLVLRERELRALILQALRQIVQSHPAIRRRGPARARRDLFL